MKKIILLVVAITSGYFSFAQIDVSNGLTPQVIEKLKVEIEREVPLLKEILTQKNFSQRQIEFSLDTFRIEQLATRKINIDFSTVGMNIAVSEMTTSYDKLMNKYYNKLMKLFNFEDRKVFLAAQRAWLAYRDNELKLIGVTIKEEYSGGGTIQSNISVGLYSSIVIERTVQLFNYYDSILKADK